MRKVALVVLGLASLVTYVEAMAVDYHVEVVLFAYLEPDPSEGPSVAVGGPQSATGSFPSSPRKLGGIAERLRNSPGYRVLAHESWRQPDLSPPMTRR